MAGKPERVGPVEIEDLRKDLLSDFSALPTQDCIQPQSENLQVFLRIRPFTSAESVSGDAQDCVTIEGPDTVILKAPRSIKSLPQTGQKFTFTQVFGPDSSQRTVFDGSVRTLVREVVDGGNCLVFTYGVTNAGKTFTFLGPDHDSGLLPRSLAVIFNSIEGKLYPRCDLKPLRCRDYSRLTPDQQNTEGTTKRTLLKLFKETDRSLTSGKTTFLEGSNVTDSSSFSSLENDSFVVDVSDSIKFSIWVSFCEIYNDHIHDLLQHIPNGQQKRTVLRLSQDVKGNSFIKDLRWVQVCSFDEAYRIMKIGKKNQSMSATRLNQLSSRSHSIFSIRLMKIDDMGVPRVLGISELALCDLAGSERCSRTHNTGDRLKEAGNINNSLLTLGKCISAMRANQHVKFQQHVPFRESKLTHFLQFFFCGSGSGRVTMVVNINQSASCFDETLNVLKFSALAQKVVVLNTRPPPLASAPPRSAMEVSLIINEAEARRFRGRKSSMLAWENSLEDVQETDDWDTDGEDDMEDTDQEETVLEAAGDTSTNEGLQSNREAALRLVLEAQIREEVGAEFMELFNKMEKDYSERLEKEREILEERAEKRVEILKNLVNRTVDLSTLDSNRQDPEEGVVLEGIISAQDLQKIREQQQNTKELETLRFEKLESEKQLQEVHQSLEQRVEQVSELNELCRQKDEIISKLTSTLDQTVEDTTRERSVVEAVRAELIQLRHNCLCQRDRGSGGGEGACISEERKRLRDSSEEESAPAKNRVLLEEEIWRLQEENEQKEQLINDLRQQQREERDQAEQRTEEQTNRLKQEITKLQEDESRLNLTVTRLQQDLDHMEQELDRLRKENSEMETRIQQLSETVCPHCDSMLQSLESEQKETSRLNKENKALVNGIFTLQNEVTELKKRLSSETGRSGSLSEELHSTQTRLHSLQSQSEERDLTIHHLRDQVEKLRHTAKEEDVFHEEMERLKEESESALKKSAQKTQQIQELQDKLQNRERVCAELKEQSSSQTIAYERVEAELKEQHASFEQRLEKIDHERVRVERENKELLELVSLREETVAEAHSQMEMLRKELERLREQLQDPGDVTENQPQDELENNEDHHQQGELQRPKEMEVTELRKVTVVEELREEIRKHQQRRNNRTTKKRETRSDENSSDENSTEENITGETSMEQRSREERRMEAVRREMQRFRELQNHNNIQRAVSGSSPEKVSERRRTPRTTGRKRKSCELQGLVFSENKRNRGRANLLKQTSSPSVKDKPLTKLGEFLNKSPSIISSTAKGLMGLVVDSRSTGSKLKRGRRKLYKAHNNSPMIDSPNTGVGGSLEDKESDHVTIKRQLRSKSRK